MSDRPDRAAAIVTGADRGIGAASAVCLASDGWGVGVLYRSAPDRAAEVVDAIVTAGGRAVAVRADVTDAAACSKAFGEVERGLGPVLGLVNNAGVRADNVAALLSDEEWERVVETNLSSAFRLARLALRRMLRARFGRIVNVASVVGPRANAGQANYAAAKAGLIGMTKTIAVEVARKGVTVNAVAPGLVETRLTADLPDAIVDSIPARRAGRPDEVAACVRFLASDSAAYVTGTTLYVDGGMAA